MLSVMVVMMLVNVAGAYEIEFEPMGKQEKKQALTIMSGSLLLGLGVSGLQYSEQIDNDNMKVLSSGVIMAGSIAVLGGFFIQPDSNGLKLSKTFVF